MSVTMVQRAGSQSMGLIARAARHSINLPVVFTSTEGRVCGRSLDISESGILATFDRPLDVWLTGQLSLLVPDQPIRLETRVVRIDHLTAAMSFRNPSARNLFLLRTLLKIPPQTP
jgi:hypothetical protein